MINKRRVTRYTFINKYRYMKGTNLGGFEELVCSR